MTLAIEWIIGIMVTVVVAPYVAFIERRARGVAATLAEYQTALSVIRAENEVYVDSDRVRELIDQEIVAVDSAIDATVRRIEEQNRELMKLAVMIGTEH